MHIVKKERVLVVVAHPDDEVLGCGGAIAAHRKRGDAVTILFMADGVTSRSYTHEHKVSRQEELTRDEQAMAHRKKEALKACSILGVQKESVLFMDLADQRLDSYPLLDVIKRIEKVKREIQPSMVYTHFWNDLNNDHQIVCRAVLTAFRPSFGKKNVSIFYMEIPETTYLSIPQKGKDFNPDHYVDIDATLASKIKALGAYKSEERNFPNPRSVKYIRQLAKLRGHQAHKKAAEAFVRDHPVGHIKEKDIRKC